MKLLFFFWGKEVRGDRIARSEHGKGQGVPWGTVIPPAHILPHPWKPYLVKPFAAEIHWALQDICQNIPPMESHP